MTSASIIGSNLLGFNFGFYHNRRNFDSKGYAVQVLGLEINPPALPHIEDLWKDCKDEEEILKRDHSRLTLQQIESLNLNFRTEGINDDGSDMIEPGWQETNATQSLTFDWSKEEEDDINMRARFILSCTDDWLQKRT
jgi:hypothetical protein